MIDEREDIEENELVLGDRISKDALVGMEKVYYPQKVEKLFVKKKKSLVEKLKFWKRGKNDLQVNPELKQPLLLLMRNNGYTDIIEGVRNGIFLINDENTGRQKGIVLSNRKLTTLNMEPNPKVYIAHEDEATPYPTDVYHDSEELVGIIRKIETNRNLLNDQAKLLAAKTIMFLAIGGIILVLLYFGFANGWFKQIFGG